jgi:2-acylglycerol O-acyltransferase 2
MNVFTLTYPLSIIILIFGFILGISISLIVFGSLSFVVIIILICIGSFRIMPIIEIFNNIVLKLFPQRIESLTNNFNKSFPVIYSNSYIHNKQYIYCFHPHGLFTISHYLHTGTNYTNWKDRNIKGTALHILWKLPFGKELTEMYNFVQSNYDDMKNVLKNNKSLSVTLGGVKEMPLSRDNKITLNIAKKRGIFKMAYQTGVPIVPIIVYGENEIYKIYNNKIFNYINNFLLHYNIYIPVPTLDSCLKWLSLFTKPLDIPVKTYVGEPIEVEKKDNPTESDIIELRELYFKGLRKLYNDTRPETYDKELYII